MADYLHSVNDAQVFTVHPGDAETPAAVWSGALIEGDVFVPSHPVSLSYASGNLTGDDEFSLIWLARSLTAQAGPEADNLRGQLARVGR